MVPCYAMLRCLEKVVRVSAESGGNIREKLETFGGKLGGIIRDFVMMFKHVTCFLSYFMIRIKNRIE